MSGSGDTVVVQVMCPHGMPIQVITVEPGQRLAVSYSDDGTSVQVVRSQTGQTVMIANLDDDTCTVEPFNV